MFEIIQGVLKEFYKALSSKRFLNINEQKCHYNVT